MIQLHFVAVLAVPLLLAASPVGAEVSFPVREEVRAFQSQALAPALLERLDKDFAVRREAVQKRGGAALARTDEGYGAKFRVRYHLANAYVDEYSGVMDGWLSEWHVQPMALSDALRLAQKVQDAHKDSLKVDFSHPVEKTRAVLRYESNGDGCMASFTFKLDAQGRCIEIDRGGAC